ncbi:3-phosphoshikimate 1-carboxyvinyltransferase [Frankia sp. Cas3]|uniref:3-phosphoshikimate 1-carboxyvinyltransferase n=1 Tax=Frankia sp. Cas3 TaxID=3073926 RepID=UPI002AD4ED5E|nr:3-phosphoshikimate 1-carboxyvinyltransferase [Frankia sp. Cas3]
MTVTTDVPIDPWPAPTAQRPVDATVMMPGSKSATNRALILAAISDGTSRLSRPLRSRDTLLMAAALRALGVAVLDDRGDWVVHGEFPLRAAPGALIDCGNAGTVARFTPALATLAHGDLVFDGDPRMRERPLHPLLDALRALGARIDGNRMPLTVHGRGRLTGGEVTVDASTSSQLVSGLLLAAPRYDHGVTVRHVGSRLPSWPYLEMTVADLRAAGASVEVDVDRTQAGVAARWSVAPGRILAHDRIIEPDINSATAFLAAAAATGGRVVLADWPAATVQPGRLLPELLTAMGCAVTQTSVGLEVRGPQRLRGIDVDLTDYGEAAPTLAALAVLADSPSRLRGIAHLRLQETDRLAALAAELGRLGAAVTVTEDGLAISPAPLSGAALDPRADHRLAMAYAVVGLVVPGVLVHDIGTTAKTVPHFDRLWAQMLTGTGMPDETVRQR